MQCLLQLLGYEVAVAHDGPSALRLALQFRPDVMLIDIRLPLMDGYQLAQELRAGGELPGLHFIALTGCGQESDHQRSRDAGFVGHLVKPVYMETVDQLLQALAV